jgi:catechol 2,3-dioxygenase-like lactoylglutathione lyase family enzyme
MTLTVQALDHLVVQVSDLEASARWYERVLGMTREEVPPAAGQPPRTEMKFGRQKITLPPVAMSKEDWFTADHEAAGSDDLCFLTDSTPDGVVQHLSALGAADRRQRRPTTRLHRHIGAARDDACGRLELCTRR